MENMACQNPILPWSRRKDVSYEERMHLSSQETDDRCCKNILQEHPAFSTCSFYKTAASELEVYVASSILYDTPPSY